MASVVNGIDPHYIVDWEWIDDDCDREYGGRYNESDECYEYTHSDYIVANRHDMLVADYRYSARSTRLGQCVHRHPVDARKVERYMRSQVEFRLTDYFDTLTDQML